MGFIGQIEVSDYLDFIVRESDHERFLNELVRFISSQPSLAHQTLKLANIPNTSPTPTVLKTISAQQGWEFETRQLDVAPYLLLSTSLDHYLAGIDKKQRHEIKRKIRKAENSAQVALRFVEDSREIPQNTAQFLALMQQDPRKARFLTADMVTFFKRFITEAFKHGDLLFSWLTINGENAAGFLSLLKNKKLYIYNSCWRADDALYSPGWIHLAKLIEWASLKGLTEIDMMRGDEEYKYRFGGIDRRVLELRLLPPIK